MSNRPARQGTRAVTTFKTPKRRSGRADIITRESLMRAIESLRLDLDSALDSGNEDSGEILERLSEIEREIDRMYWYILAPTMICATLVCGISARSFIDWLQLTFGR